MNLLLYLFIMSLICICLLTFIVDVLIFKFDLLCIKTFLQILCGVSFPLQVIDNFCNGKLFLLFQNILYYLNVYK